MKIPGRHSGHQRFQQQVKRQQQQWQRNAGGYYVLQRGNLSFRRVTTKG